MRFPPGSGAVVMGTGIVSEALSLAHQETASRIVFGLGVGAWLALGVLIGLRLIWDRGGFLAEAQSPVGLTAVAASAVLGARIVSLGALGVGIALLIIALIAGLGLATGLLHARRLPRTGSAFILTVSVQSLAVLAATIAATARAPWLLDAALATCAFGLLLYPVALTRFDPAQLLFGAGDQWVAGGALAISALAISEITIAARRLMVLGAAVPALHLISLLVWTASMLWLPVLAATEIASPRLRYDTRRWATVFPVGMYAVCSYRVASATNVAAIRAFAGVWTRASFVIWLLVFAAMLVAGARAARRRLGVRSPRDCRAQDNRRERRISAG